MAKQSVYTDAVVESMVNAYKAAADEAQRDGAVHEMANELGVNVHSVRAKLSSLGVYIPKTRAAKNGEPIVSKADLVGDIAECLGVHEEVIDSLEKANKGVLKLILKGLKKEDQVPFEDENPSQV